MGRLTERDIQGQGIWVKDHHGNFDYFDRYLDDRFPAIEKLAHYEDLEEAGRLIELPCAVGDTVWDIGSVFGKIPVQHKIETQIYALFAKNLFGQRFFLTKEEAEAKLKQLEEDHIADVGKMGKE